MSRDVKRAFTAIGVFVDLARMVAFGLIGYGLINAVVDYNAGKAIGLDGALNKLLLDRCCWASSPPGGSGFALYSIADARYAKL